MNLLARNMLHPIPYQNLIRIPKNATEVQTELLTLFLKTNFPIERLCGRTRGHCMTNMMIYTMLSQGKGTGCLCFDLCGPARDNHEGHEFQGTERNKLWGTAPWIFRGQAWGPLGQLQEHSYALLLKCSLRAIASFVLKMCGHENGRLLREVSLLNLRIRTRYVLDVSRHRQRP